ncbi:hypothetical protein [Nocardioides dubius]|uniref:hypothetical protein n=1 Tax=Nocardioides dubius TaxID=317019 RepID=UPI0031D79BB1
MALTCSFCGASSATTDPGSGDALPLTWSTGVENGAVRYFCATCTRANLRAMEGKLDSAWW